MRWFRVVLTLALFFALGIGSIYVIPNRQLRLGAMFFFGLIVGNIQARTGWLEKESDQWRIMH